MEDFRLGFEDCFTGEQGRESVAWRDDERVRDDERATRIERQGDVEL